MGQQAPLAGQWLAGVGGRVAKAGLVEVAEAASWAQGLGSPKGVARAEMGVGVAAGVMGQVAERVGASPPAAGALGDEKGRQGWIPVPSPPGASISCPSTCPHIQISTLLSAKVAPRPFLVSSVGATPAHPAP